MRSIDQPIVKAGENDVGVEFHSRLLQVVSRTFVGCLRRNMEMFGRPTCTLPQVGLHVEAAGIEPASRDIFMKASTCVVDCLILARADSNRQDAARASRELV